jgi:hypothetical protein
MPTVDVDYSGVLITKEDTTTTIVLRWLRAVVLVVVGMDNFCRDSISLIKKMEEVS